MSSRSSAIAAESCEKVSGTIVPPELGSVVQLREFRRKMDESGLVHVAAIEFDFVQTDDQVDSVPIVRMRTGDDFDTDRVLIHFHGGGYIVGSPRGNASIPIQVARAAGMEVVSVDYRLAPEYPFPCAVDDALDVYRALRGRYSPASIGVFGESAGGGLAAALVLALRDAQEPLPGALALIAPFADMTGSGVSITANDGQDPDLNWASLAPGAEAYSGAQDPENPLLSPVFADYSGAPPMLIHAGSREILLSDAERIAERAEAAGVEVRLEVWEDMWHCFHFDPQLPEAQRACAGIGEFFSRNLS